jgi:hypothetical protein
LFIFSRRKPKSDLKNNNYGMIFIPGVLEKALIRFYKINKYIYQKTEKN